MGIGGRSAPRARCGRFAVARDQGGGREGQLRSGGAQGRRVGASTQLPRTELVNRSKSILNQVDLCCVCFDQCRRKSTTWRQRLPEGILSFGSVRASQPSLLINSPCFALPVWGHGGTSQRHFSPASPGGTPAQEKEQGRRKQEAPEQRRQPQRIDTTLPHTQQRQHMTHNMRTSTAKEHMQMSIAIGCS